MTDFLKTLRCTLAALALVSVSAGTGMAKTVPVVPGQVIGQVEVPNNWTVNTTERGMELASPDEEVMMWMEVYQPGQVDAVMREHQTYFTEQGVRINGRPTERESVNNGVRLSILDFPSTWKGAPTILSYLIFSAEARPSQTLMVTYWASPEGDRRYGAQVRSVITSTSFTLR